MRDIILRGAFAAALVLGGFVAVQATERAPPADTMTRLGAAAPDAAEATAAALLHASRSQPAGPTRAAAAIDRCG